MTSDPLVSVIVPAYNAERFIERTLQSAIAQTHRNIEIIVVDDGSTDTTPALARTLASGDERIRVITTRNGGVAKARNTGIDAASGAFVAFLDADDLWHPTKVERQLSALAANSEAVAAYAFHRPIDADDRVLGMEGGLACSGYTFARHLYAKFVGNGSSMIVRRDIAVSVGGFESSWAMRGLGGCEDLDFEAKITSRFPIVAVPEYLVGYRTYPGNMSSDRLRMARAVVATVEHHVNRNPSLPKWAARKGRASTREYALHLLLAERRWSLIAKTWLLLGCDDASRALTLAVQFMANKVRRSMRLLPNRQSRSVPSMLFSDLGSNSVAELSIWERPRNQIEAIRKLSKIDARMGLSHSRREPQGDEASAIT